MPRMEDTPLDAAMAQSKQELARQNVELRAELAEAKRGCNDAIIAPAECDPNCDDPNCQYSHTPLTLRQAYENCLDRVRDAEADYEAVTRHKNEALAKLDLLVGAQSLFTDKIAGLEAELEEAIKTQIVRWEDAAGKTSSKHLSAWVGVCKVGEINQYMPNWNWNASMMLRFQDAYFNGSKFIGEFPTEAEARSAVTSRALEALTGGEK